MRYLVSLIAGTALLSPPAFAQREVNASNANQYDRVVADNARAAKSDTSEDTAPAITPLAAQAMYNFAGCVVENSRDGAVKLLAKDYRSAQYREDMGKLAKGHDRCAANSTLGFSGVVFAGNLAEHLLTDKFSDAALAANLGRDRSATPIEARGTLEAVSMCIVMRAPKESAALFRTDVASDAEKAALGAIAPQLPTCVKQGTQFKTNRSGLRALLALAAYRVAVTSEQGTAG